MYIEYNRRAYESCGLTSEDRIGVIPAKAPRILKEDFIEYCRAWEKVLAEKEVFTPAYHCPQIFEIYGVQDYFSYISRRTDKAWLLQHIYDKYYHGETKEILDAYGLGGYNMELQNGHRIADKFFTPTVLTGKRDRNGIELRVGDKVSIRGCKADWGIIGMASRGGSAVFFATDTTVQWHLTDEVLEKIEKHKVNTGIAQGAKSMHKDLQQRAFQNKIDKGFNTTDTDTELGLLSSEVAELAEALKQGDKRAAAMELADIAIYCYGLAEMLGADLDSCVETKMTIFQNRLYSSTKEKIGYKGYGTEFWAKVLAADTLHIQLADVTEAHIHDVDTAILLNYGSDSPLIGEQAITNYIKEYLLANHG